MQPRGGTCGQCCRWRRYAVYLLYWYKKVQILTPEELLAKAKALQQLLRLLALLVQKYKY